MAPNQTADDSLQPSTSRVSLLPIFGHVLVHGLAGFILLTILVKGVPHAEEMFLKFDTLLPGPTQITLKCSGWCMYNWFLTPLLLLIDGGILWGLSKLPRPLSRAPGAYSLLVMLACFLFLAFILVAVGMPLIQQLRQLH